MSKRRGLGRGLGEMGVSELLSNIQSLPAITPAEAPKAGLQTLTVSQLQPGEFQPRQHMDPDALEELSHSIKAQGIIQPIVVRQKSDHYEIIAGERRWRAAKMAGLSEVPVVIRDLPDQTVLAIALIENIQRQDLNALEEAGALNRLMKEFGMTHQEVAQSVGRSRAAVSNLLRLLKLHPAVKSLLSDKKLEMGHARALLSLDKEMQLPVAHRVIAASLNVRQTEQLIQHHLHGAEKSKKTDQIPENTNADVQRLERQLADTLGARVNIKQQNAQKGQLIITYHSLDELDGIMAHIQ